MAKPALALGVQKRYFPLLDVLRGPAAMLVFAEHWRNLFFVDFAVLENPSAITNVFYLLTGAGHQAVMIFFVLSGCVIAHVMQTMNDRDRWSWSSYLSARLTRLWVVLIPALVLTAGWDFLGMTILSGPSSIYSGTGFGNIVNAPVQESSSLLDFLGNAIFLQTILVPTFGSNGPLWSIAFEFVYYLVYPAMVIACLLKSRLWKRLLCVVFAAALLYLGGRPIAGSFPIWLAGTACYAVFRKWPARPQIAFLGFVLGTVTILSSIIGSRILSYSTPLDWDVVIAACTALTLYFALSVQASKRLMLMLRPFHALSAI
ncbi:acyltransferase family protein [Crateriforma conspicua]|uniref:Acyltransferase family protein n=1 Tax=Crateriforma conspicua TaxID=2527996 RepID=A0A5C5XT95_9PLAN|nr:acyltransferase family protein [Crateriforma conspicua]TWT65553.1 Acyltransferase family protein [Crateriforma conspicua]